MIIVKVFHATFYITCCFGPSLYSFMYGLNFEINPSYVLGKSFFLLIQARTLVGLWWRMAISYFCWSGL